MTEQEKREKVSKGLEQFISDFKPFYGNKADWKRVYDALALLKAQEPEAMDAPKPDSDIGCWYDITHNYTLEQVVSALKAQEPPTSESISSAIECLLHPQDADDSDMAKAIDTAVRAMRLLKAQEPRVMTLWEAVGIIDRPVYLERNVLMPDKSVNRQECYALVCATDDDHMIRLATPYGEEKWHVGAYGIGWRCWTSRPDEKRRAETPWNL